MCGISGIWRFASIADGNDVRNVRAMISAMVHRGPDGQGFFKHENLALGHCRLSIIELTDHGSQPMSTRDGLGCIAYNGEVYNYRQLREDLICEGVTFRGNCDTEVVLNALHHWGVDRAIRRFDGMFAIAYYDFRDKVLWLVRDRLGIKAISVAQIGDRFLFASEDKGILATDVMSTEISAREITMRLTLQNLDSYSSVFHNIRRIPPGGCWKITRNGVEEQSFWHVLDDLDPHRLQNNQSSARELGKTLETLLRQSVEMHCISDVPLATACSGGIDSGLITAFAKSSVPDYHGYVVDPDQGVNETEAAQRSGMHVGVPILPVCIDREIFLRNWAKSIYHLESDGGHSSTPALLAMTERCRHDGIKVLLTGEGSDELFGGYPWHRGNARRWRRLDPPLSYFRSSKWQKRTFERLRQAPFFSSLGSANWFERDSVIRGLSPQYNLLQTRIIDHLAPIGNHFDRALIGAGVFDLYGHMQNIIHRHDRLSMASSVELRVPFLENKIIDFALHLPAHFKNRYHVTKWLLKTVARKYLPKKNVTAPKLGFPISESYTEGSEILLHGGYLADVMGWTSQEVKSLIEISATNGGTRRRLVGMELLVRQYCNGETYDNQADELMAINAGRTH